MLPTIIAFTRGHHQRVAILLTNLFLGWTFLGWIAALIWSATATQHAVALAALTNQPAEQMSAAASFRRVGLAIVLIAAALAVTALLSR